jgi:hypothetical protein
MQQERHAKCEATGINDKKEGHGRNAEDREEKKKGERGL